MAGQGKGAVFVAIIGNGILTVLKFIAFLMTGSGAMMSEAVHSFADTSNQGLLYFGMRRSLRPADSKYQYGYGADRYVFALMSAMGIFILGCGVTVYHGVHSLLHPPEISFSWVSYAVLGASIVVEGYVLSVAAKEVNSGRGKKSFFQFVQTSSDPTLIAVLLEDFVATAGAVVAVVGITLANITGNPIYDSITSIVIGAMLGLMAIWLGWRNRQLILGPAIPAEVQAEILQFLREQPSVGRIRGFRTRIVAAKSYRVAADIDYDGTYLGKKHAAWLRERAETARAEGDWDKVAAEFGERLLNDLAIEVDEVEREMVSRFPKVHHIDMEAD